MKVNKLYEDKEMVNQNNQPDQSKDLKIKKIGARKNNKIITTIIMMLWTMFFFSDLINVLEYWNNANGNFIIPKSSNINAISTIVSVLIISLISFISSYFILFKCNKNK